LSFEGLESREVPSTASLPPIGPTTSPGFDSGTTPLPKVPANLIQPPTYALLQQYVNQVHTTAANPVPSGYATKVQALDPTPVPTNPTPAEVAREYFVGKFIGRYTIGPGRQAGQALTIHAYNTYEAGSNQFLKGKAQLILSTSSAPSGTPVSGLVSFFTQSFLQSGNLLIIDVGKTNQTAGAPDLSAPTVMTHVGGLLLPTQASWAFDTTSGGAYTAPMGFTQGGGQLSIAYTPDATPKAGTLGSGKIEVLLQGLINVSSILNATDKGYN
jgi:hypothetical protein